MLTKSSNSTVDSVRDMPKACESLAKNTRTATQSQRGLLESTQKRTKRKTSPVRPCLPSPHAGAFFHSLCTYQWHALSIYLCGNSGTMVESQRRSGVILSILVSEPVAKRAGNCGPTRDVSRPARIKRRARTPAAQPPYPTPRIGAGRPLRQICAHGAPRAWGAGASVYKNDTTATISRAHEWLREPFFARHRGSTPRRYSVPLGKWGCRWGLLERQRGRTPRVSGGAKSECGLGLE